MGKVTRDSLMFQGLFIGRVLACKFVANYGTKRVISCAEEAIKSVLIPINCYSCKCYRKGGIGLDVCSSL